MAELLEGQTVYRSHFNTTVAPLSSMAYVNDRAYSTDSTIPPGVTIGTAWHAWNVNFGAPVAVEAMRVWDPVGADTWPSSISVVEYSDDGSAWTNAPYSLSSGSAPSGTEIVYTLTGGPLTHQWWRIRLIYSGFHQAWGISEWFIDGPDPSVVANFIGQPTAGALPLEVEFTDTSTGGPVSWLWDFGDGGTSTEQHPTHTYIVAGAYDVTLTIDGGADELVRTEYIVVGVANTPPDIGGAILEIYVHDEDASRWGEATWATGPATGTEGIWSAAGWQDVTPQGVWAHIIWGSRRPGRGILASQDPASWNVETYDPERILDPGNGGSPFWPQLVSGVPIRVSHDSGLVIRTGYIEEISYNHKPPAYRGQILATDTIALLYKANVPADSILANTLHARVIDAIEAAGIAVGGIPLPPPDYGGPTLSDWIEGAATDEGTSVWEVIRKACEEILWVPFVNHDAGLGLRSWGAPLNRGREISAPNLEDLRSLVDEDGVYSVARVQVADPDLDPIEREAAPLPRYGRRVIDRREPTIDAEAWASAVLQERSWPGVQYIPGTIHCFDRDDVEYFGSLQTMERVTVILPGVVSVQGRILGGELWVEHRRGSEDGATWQFKFAVATDGSTAIGLDTLVSDQGGDPLLDDMTEADYLEAD